MGYLRNPFETAVKHLLLACFLSCLQVAEAGIYCVTSYGYRYCYDTCCYNANTGYDECCADTTYSLSTGAIIGIVIGVVGFVVGAIVIIQLCKKYNKNCQPGVSPERTNVSHHTPPKKVHAPPPPPVQHHQPLPQYPPPQQYPPPLAYDPAYPPAPPNPYVAAAAGPY